MSSQYDYGLALTEYDEMNNPKAKVSFYRVLSINLRKINEYDKGNIKLA